MARKLNSEQLRRVREQMEERNLLIAEQRRDDLKAVLNDEQGRRYLWALLSDCGVFVTTYRGSSEGIFLEGRRAVGCALLAEIVEADSRLYLLMQAEGIQATEEENRVRAALEKEAAAQKEGASDGD